MENKPQLENGFIRIATGNEKNDILMALVEAKLTGVEYQICLLIIRKTWGYNKKEDKISLSQLTYFTGRTTRAISKSTLSLENKNILVRKRNAGKMSVYSINKNFYSWEKTREQMFLGNKKTKTREQMFLSLGNWRSPTKDNITKDNITKDNKLFLFLEKFNHLMGTEYRITEHREKMFNARLKTYSLEELERALMSLSKSPFHKGDNDRGWKADPDFLLRNDEQIDKFLNMIKGKEVHYEPINPDTIKF